MLRDNIFNTVNEVKSFHAMLANKTPNTYESVMYDKKPEELTVHKQYITAKTPVSRIAPIMEIFFSLFLGSLTTTLFPPSALT